MATEKEIKKAVFFSQQKPSLLAGIIAEQGEDTPTENSTPAENTGGDNNSETPAEDTGEGN